VTYDPSVIEVTSCAVTGTSVTGTCTGAPGALAVAFERASVAAISGTVSIVRLEVVVRSPGEYAVTFASPAFEDDSGAAVPVGLPPSLSLSTGATLTPTVTRTLTTTPTVASTVAATPVTLTFTTLAAGWQHTCGVAAGGATLCWGQNRQGQLGDGTSANVRTVPVAVAGGHRFSAVTAGWSHTCGLVQDGTAWCWGANFGGQLGDGTTDDRPAPVAVGGGRSYRSIAAGFAHTCAVALDGTAYCWGRNDSGQLGDGTKSQTLTTVPSLVAGSAKYVQVVAGETHTCGLGLDGAARCWGGNWAGQVGDGTGATGLASTDRPAPVTVTGGLTFAKLTAWMHHTCGITGAGGVWCWGRNDTGQVGDGTPNALGAPSPVVVAGGGAYGTIAAGGMHTCALATGGEARCWGANYHGQLGNGTNAGAPTPVAVVGARTYAFLASGHSHACALDQAGGAWCWGENEYGQLGNGESADGCMVSPCSNSANQSVPVAVVLSVPARTPTPTPTLGPSPSATPVGLTATRTLSPTRTPSATWTLTALPTRTNTPGPSPTATATLTPTVTATPTPFGWMTPTASPTQTASATVGPTQTLTVTPGPSPTLIKDWGSFLPVRPAVNAFAAPRGIAVASDGSIYVADTRNHRVKRLATDGTTISMWGVDGGRTAQAGTGPGEFSNPYGIAIDASGNVFVSEYGNHRVQKLSADGTPIASWGSYGSGVDQFAYPHGLSIDTSGTIFVADTHNNRLQVLSASGAFIASYDLVGRPEGVLVLNPSSLIVSNSCAMRIEIPSRTSTWRATLMDDLRLVDCSGFARDTDGSLLLAASWLRDGLPQSEGSTLLRIDVTSGATTLPFGPGASTCVLELGYMSESHCVPIAMAVEPSGTILVTDVGRNKVVRLSRDGRVLAEWG
jgi:alpha-tubulin suppressor-like RCC1 family protein